MGGGDEVISLSYVAEITPPTLRKVIRISFIVFQYPAIRHRHMIFPCLEDS
jgi:hypothetical protein